MKNYNCLCESEPIKKTHISKLGLIPRDFNQNA